MKGEFLTILRVEDYNGGREWLLIEPLRYRTSKGEVIEVPATSKLPKDHPDFWTWNGASIPCFFWRVMGSPFCGLHRRPSVLHDWLWMQAGRRADEDSFRKVSGLSEASWGDVPHVYSYRFANWVFWDAMIACGEPRWSAWLKWLATAFWSSLQKGGWR